MLPIGSRGPDWLSGAEGHRVLSVSAGAEALTAGWSLNEEQRTVQQRGAFAFRLQVQQVSGCNGGGDALHAPVTKEGTL